MSGRAFSVGIIRTINELSFLLVLSKLFGAIVQHSGLLLVIWEHLKKLGLNWSWNSERKAWSAENRLEMNGVHSDILNELQKEE